MARRKNDSGDYAGDHRGDNDPADKNHEWLEIYARLKESIGEWPAYNWFGHCRYLSRHDGVIRLEHWTPWAAEESLKRHGLHLCRAAGVKRAMVRFNGGSVPNERTARKVEGCAEYQMPREGVKSREPRRLGALWPGTLERPVRGDAGADYGDF